METIHCRMTKEQLNNYGTQIGLLVKPDIDARRYDHACSWMIAFKMIDEIGQISILCKHGYTEIINSFSLMTRWMNYRKIVDCMKVACDMWVNPQASVIFDKAYLKTRMEDYPTQIHDDICCFAAWAIYRGADGASIRRELPSKIQDNVRTIIKRISDDGVISMFWRALMSYQIITDKAIEPIYKESFKHGAKEGVQLNSLANAFKTLRKEVA